MGYKLLGLVLSFVVFGSWVGVRFSRDVSFNQGCGGHLKLAAHTTSVEVAKTELQTALTYLDQNNMTSGYTSVWYNTPDEDVGFWYNKLKLAHAQLVPLNDQISDSERSLVLLKLNESLLSGHDDWIVKPMGISVFGHNTAYFYWGWLSAIVLVIFFLAVLFHEEPYRRK